MICPKCKNQIDDSALKCPHCNVRVATLCKQCNAFNKILNLSCVSCGFELLKTCPECKSVNLPSAKICRKCKYIFAANTSSQQQNSPSVAAASENPIQNDYEEAQSRVVAETDEPIIPLRYDANFDSQQTAKDKLIKSLTSYDKKIISISGEKGVGKSIVLKSTMNELKSNQMTWLYGECNPIIQLSPCGLIQDILLTFFNVTNFCADSLKLKKDSQKFFQSEFPTLTNEEIFNLLNFLYPTNQAYYENILTNKEKTFTFLEKVFATIIDNNETIFVIDNFEAIDGLSYEFLHRLLNSDFLIKTFKVLITYSELRPAVGYLYSPNLKNKSYLDISLNSFDKNQIDSFIQQLTPAGKQLPTGLKQQLSESSFGNPAVLEQMVMLTTQYEARNKAYLQAMPKSFSEIVEARINFLKQDNIIAFKVLSAAAIQGIKFYPALLKEIFEYSEEEITTVLRFLQESGFIVQASEFAYTFKNSMLWTSILELIKTDENFMPLAENVFESYSKYTLSSNSMLAVIAQNLNQPINALKIWTHTIKIAAHIGDTNLYIIAQKQCLTLLDKVTVENEPLIKANIYERLGKLLTQSNPNEAMEYLPTAITNARNNDDTIKEIELTGYLANCCINLGDYFGTIECVDTVIDRIDDEFELEIAMLKSRKLDALLNIGNCGQIVNIVDNEIMPIFEKYIDSKPHKNIALQSLYIAWLKTYLTLANALVFQGNNRSFEVLATLFDLFKKNEFNDQLFICKAKLAMAFANTIKGDVETSESILEDIIKVYKTDIMDNEAISRWNLINILNNFTHKKYTGLKEELFQVVSFANNINDNFTKNILKTLLGKILKDEENAKRAVEIYGEQITYFAKEKNAIGALVTWYLIAEAELIIEGPEKSLEIAQKALDVAQSPKINNYLFIALYNKVIAEAYMAKSDYESAKVYIEKAIMIARKFELLDILAKLYLLYGKYLQDIALVKSEAQVDYVMGASNMYKKALLISQTIKNESLTQKVEQAKVVLNSFCQLNGITLK